jgi:prepilin peptidase CpaA
MRAVASHTALLAYAALAAWWDVRVRRIPNRLSAAAFVAALAVAPGDGGIGLGAALGGLAVGASLLLVPFAAGAVGGGDVKFAAVAGAFLGPGLALYALAIGTSLGLVLALAAAARAGRAVESLRGAARLAWLTAATATLPPAPAEPGGARPAAIPYVVPLAAGVAAALVLEADGWFLT